MVPTTIFFFVERNKLNKHKWKIAKTSEPPSFQKETKTMEILTAYKRSVLFTQRWNNFRCLKLSTGIGTAWKIFLNGNVISKESEANVVRTFPPPF